MNPDPFQLDFPPDVARQPSKPVSDFELVDDDAEWQSSQLTQAYHDFSGNSLQQLHTSALDFFHTEHDVISVSDSLEPPTSGLTQHSLYEGNYGNIYESLEDSSGTFQIPDNSLQQLHTSAPDYSRTENGVVNLSDSLEHPASGPSQHALYEGNYDHVYESLEDSSGPFQIPPIVHSEPFSFASLPLNGLPSAPLSYPFHGSDDVLLGSKPEGKGKKSIDVFAMLDHIKHRRQAGQTQDIKQKRGTRHQAQNRNREKAYRCSKKGRQNATKRASFIDESSSASCIAKSRNGRSHRPLSLSPTSLYNCLLTISLRGLDRMVVESKDDSINSFQLSHSSQGSFRNEQYAIDLNITVEPILITRDSVVAEQYRWYQPASKRSRRPDNLQYRCTSGCCWSTTRKADWEAHEKGHYPPMVWLCPHKSCTLRGGKLPVFMRQDILNKHLKTRHKELPDPSRAKACRIQIHGSQFPTQCIVEHCEGEFTSLQDRLDHIDREHFSRYSVRPWRTIQQNKAPVPTPTPQEDTDVELESSDSETASTSSGSSSSDEDDDPATGNGGSGGDNRTSFLGFKSHTRNFPSNYGSGNQSSKDSGFVHFGRLMSSTVVYCRSRLWQRYASQGLVLLPILLGCMCNDIPEVLSQARLYTRKVLAVSHLKPSDISMVRRELTLVDKILHQSSLNCDGIDEQAQLSDLEHHSPAKERLQGEVEWLSRQQCGRMAWFNNSKPMEESEDNVLTNELNHTCLVEKLSTQHPDRSSSSSGSSSRSSSLGASGMTHKSRVRSDELTGPGTSLSYRTSSSLSEEAQLKVSPASARHKSVYVTYGGPSASHPPRKVNVELVLPFTHC